MASVLTRPVDEAPASCSAELWLVDLSQPHAAADERLLADEEVARAARFVFPRDRDRFVRGRLALRRLLGEELGCNPGEVPITTSEHGRPLCPALPESRDFNLSNSEELALIALASTRPVGIDIERLRPMHDLRDLSRRFFSCEEADAIDLLEPAERNLAFLTCWTRKEAVLKALGLGLYLDPASVLTGVEPAAATVATAQGDFEIQTLRSADRWVATLATPAPAAIHLQVYEERT